MDKKDFIVNEELIEVDVFGEKFKIKPVTSGDELRWMDDYMIEVEEKGKDGKVIIKRKQDQAKLTLCKMRNIMEVPYSQEELTEMFTKMGYTSHIDKPWSEFTDYQKEIFVGKLHQDVFNILINALNINKKKD